MNELTPKAPTKKTARLLMEPVLLLCMVAAGPFFGLYARNFADHASRSEILEFAPMAIVALVGSYAIGFAILRPKSFRLSSLLAIFGFLFFQYGAVSDLVARIGGGAAAQAAVWLLLLVAGLGLAFALGQRLGFHRALMVVAATGLLVPGYSIATFRGQPVGPALPIEEAFPLAGNQIWSGEPVRLPSIYWIVPDSYPADAELTKRYLFDNSSFLNALRDRDFFIARQSFSSYSNTLLSVSSTLDMDYLFDEHDRFSVLAGGVRTTLPGKANRGLKETIAGDNRTVGFLKQLGYRYVHFEARTYDETQCRGYEDVCINGMPLVRSDLQSVLLAQIPYRLLSAFGDAPLARPKPVKAGTKTASGTGIPELASGLAGLEADGPVFVYAHIYSPHAPNTNDPECNVIGERRGRLWKRAFTDQVLCVNRQLLQLVDEILERDPEAIVIINSDHGPRSTRRADVSILEYSQKQIREYLTILNAIRMPESCAAHLQSDIVPINTMRAVFACLGGHAPRYVEPRYFLVRASPGSADYGLIRKVSPHEPLR